MVRVATIRQSHKRGCLHNSSLAKATKIPIYFVVCILKQNFHFITNKRKRLCETPIIPNWLALFCTVCLFSQTQEKQIILRKEQIKNSKKGESLNSSNNSFNELSVEDKTNLEAAKKLLEAVRSGKELTFEISEEAKQRFKNYQQTQKTKTKLEKSSTLGDAFANGATQDLVVHPSPAGMYTISQAEAGVDTYTGKANVSVPIHTLISRDISVPISLSYNSSGNKVDDIGSWVGQGWNLNAGGAITRVMHNLPDEYDGDIVNGVNVFDAYGYLKLKNAPLDGDPNCEGQDGIVIDDWNTYCEVKKQKIAAYSKWHTFQNCGNFGGVCPKALDTEPDEFYFNFGKYSGKFVFDQDGNIHTIPYQNLQINQTIQTINNVSKITQFTVTTPEGVTYIFGDANLDSVEESRLENFSHTAYYQYEYMGCAITQTNPVLYVYFPNPSTNKISDEGAIVSNIPQNSTGGNNGSFTTYSYFTSTWYLKEITSPTFDNVTFDYEDTGELHYRSSVSYNSDMPNFYSDIVICNINGVDVQGRFFLSPIVPVSNPVQTNLIYPQLASFTQSVNEVYLKGKRLKSIVPSTGLSLDFVANTNGPNMWGDGGYDKMLDEIRLLNGTTEIKSWQLHYEDVIGGLLLEQDTFCYNIWDSFFSGLPLECFTSKTNYIDLKYAHLQNTGQTSQTYQEYIDYYEHILFTEQDRIYLDFITQEGSNNSTLNLFDFEYNTDNELPFRFSTQQDLHGYYNYNNYNSLLPKINYTSSGGTSESQDGATPMIGWMNIKNYNPITLSFAAGSFDGHNTGAHATRSKTRVLEKINLLTGGSIRYDYELNRYGPSDIHYGHGLRVTSITRNPEGIGQSVIQNYTYGEGVRVSETYRKIGSTFWYNDRENKVSFSSSFLRPVYYTKGATIGYSSVNISTPNNGYIKHIYKTEDDVPNGTPPSSYRILNTGEELVTFPSNDWTFPYPNKTDNDWQRGLVEKTEAFNESGQKVREVIYDWDIDTPEFPTTEIKGLKGATFETYPGTVVNGSFLMDGIRRGIYTHQSDWVKLNSTTETVYGLNGNDGVTTQTTYTYNANPATTHLNPIEVSFDNSDGKTHTTNYFYPHDVNWTMTGTESAAVSEMLNDHQVNMRLRTSKYVDGSLVDGQWTAYKLFAGTSGNITLPHIYYSYKGSWLQEAEFFDYTSTGYPLEVQRRGWNKEYYTWQDGLVRTKDFNNWHWEWDWYFTTNRQLKTATDIDGQIVTYTYDAFQRVDEISERNSNVLTEIEYAYTGNGATDNYLKTAVHYTPISGSDLDSIVTINYMDGLSRQIQTIQKQHYIDTNDNSYDVATTIAYDAQGRVWKEYEPYSTGNDTGAYDSGFTSEPFTETLYENSPLSRVTSVTPPNWYATTYDYGSNTSSIVDLEVFFDYPANSLYTTTATDPNGNKAISFTDKKGRTIINRRTDNGNTATADTRYRYDDRDRPVYMFPPGTNHYSLGLYYGYSYDDRDNLITKLMPDTDPIYYVYDDRDLQVGMRNAILETANSWMATKYDDYGRAEERGFYTGTTIADPNNFNIATPIKRNFYDNYHSSGDIYVGKLARTEVRQKIIDLGVGFDWVNTNYYYDNYGRLSQSTGNSYLNTTFGSDTYTFSYDYADNQRAIYRVHQSSSGESFTTNQVNEYDHEGRHTKMFFAPQFLSPLICEMNYTSKDQLRTKYLGNDGANFLQKIDYFYNAQGWLTGINNVNAGQGFEPVDCNPVGIASPTSSFLGSVDDDLFSLSISYGNIDTDFGFGAQQNGNISQLTWRVMGRKKQTYGYDYDYLDRLTDAIYGQYQDGISATLDKTNEYSTTYAYDIRGNITQLTRQGKKLHFDCYEQGTIDNLTYSYYPGSNQFQRISDLANIDCIPERYLYTELFGTQTYSARNKVYSNNDVRFNADITLQAEQCIEMDAGFGVELGSEFLAHIAPCEGGGIDFSTEGFEHTSNADFIYDDSGNMVYDPNKDLHFEYNYMNLPFRITSGDGTKKIEIHYDADGIKRRREVIQDGTTLYTQHYLDGIEYRNDTISTMYHSEGRVENSGSTSTPAWEYQYYLRDHLGNNRITFINNNGQAEIIQEHHPYPFGLAQNGMFTDNSSNKYLYNNKEFTNDFNLGWYDYGFRNYRPDFCRFISPDPISDEFPHVSTYNYAENRVPNGIDFWGLQYVSIHSALFSIANLQTWQNTGTYQSGIDNLGQPYIGTSVPINLARFNVPSGRHPTGSLRAMKDLSDAIEYRRSTLQVAKSTNMPDRRFNTTKKFNNDVRGIGRVGLMLEAVNLAADVNSTIESFKSVVLGTDESTQQQLYIKKSWQGVVDGINAGYFEEDQITVDNLSAVADYLYRGTPIEDGELEGVAKRISKEILDNARLEVVYPDSGLDNFKMPSYVEDEWK